MHFFVTHVVVPYMPHHSVPRLGSACPQSGIAPWARRDRPSLAVSRLPRHPCRGAHCAIPACGHRGLTGRLRSKARSKAEQQQQQQQRQSAQLHPPVGAGLPAITPARTPRGVRYPTSSLTTFASKLAPTGVSLKWRALAVVQSTAHPPPRQRLTAQPAFR